MHATVGEPAATENVARPHLSDVLTTELSAGSLRYRRVVVPGVMSNPLPASGCSVAAGDSPWWSLLRIPRSGEVFAKSSIGVADLEYSTSCIPRIRPAGGHGASIATESVEHRGVPSVVEIGSRTSSLHWAHGMNRLTPGDS